MVEGNKYCVDIVTQVLALEGSLHALSRLVLESHLNSCGAEKLGFSDPKEKERFIKEIIKLLIFQTADKRNNPSDFREIKKNLEFAF